MNAMHQERLGVPSLLQAHACINVDLLSILIFVHSSSVIDRNIAEGHDEISIDVTSKYN